MADAQMERWTCNNARHASGLIFTIVLSGRIYRSVYDLLNDDQRIVWKSTERPKRGME